MRQLALALLLCGCGARSSLLDPADGASSSEVGALTRDGRVVRTDAGCRVTLSVGSVKASPASCWIDQKVANQTTTLDWNCDSGEAMARFAVPFTGRVTAGVVALAATTTFAWSDGCTWQSRQQIEGALASGSLAYAYSEEPVQGSGCAPAYCKASAAVLVK